MKLILFRHGTATPKDPHHTDLDDFKRVLTKRGRKDIRRMLKSERHLLKQITLIATSPLLRASETADLLHHDLSSPDFELWPELDGLCPPELAVPMIPQEGCVALVGHEPHLSSVARLLLGTEDLDVEIPKSGLMVLERSSKGWKLRRLTGPVQR